MYLFDTNIFLEYLLDQAQADACGILIDSIHRNKSAWITSFSLHAIETIVGSKPKNKKLLLDFLTHLQSHPYFKIYTTTLEEEIEIIQLCPKIGLDFDDALQYFVAKKKGFSLITLDKDFSIIKDIEVIHPLNFSKQIR